MRFFLIFVAIFAMPVYAEVTTNDTTRDAFSQPVSGLSEAERIKFFKGRGLVRQVWVIPPSENREISGLGPLYNRISCVACHVGNGRGFAPDKSNESMRAMLVRLSIPSSDEKGGPKPHPAYGGQLNEHGVPGVAGEGRAEVSYIEQEVKLKDGVSVYMRKPALNYVDLAYGSFGNDIMTSPRITPPLFGLGLLQAVPDETIVALAQTQKADGIRGRVNRVWDVIQQKTVLGRFGWKANMPNLRQQIAGAFVGDMGITSPLFPQENCTAIQMDCQKSPSAGQPELTSEQLESTEFYHLALAAPQQRDRNDAEVIRGAAIFRQAQCAACHVPELKTGNFKALPRLSGQTIHPYTDLLLHDMGESLADHRPDYLASGREWRTPPLWGIGLAQKIEPRAGYLHDGRARTLLEAILWHDGEGAISAKEVSNLSSQDRQALLRFLQSL